jgi:G3E family GTPase
LKPISTHVFVAMLAASFALHADIIDRIAVSVGNSVITTSDIERQIRVAAFVSGTKPDLSPAARRKTAEALVDQQLIRRELQTSHYPETDSAALDAAFDQFKKKYFHSEEEYRRALAEDGITEADVKEELNWQRTWSGFVGVRFQPAAQVNDQDIREYFDHTVAPAARAANPDAPVALDDFRDRIVTKLMGDRQDALMEQWLTEARRRTEIVYHEEAFQ